MARELEVLILEDQPSDAELMVDALRQGGFDPTWERVETKEAYVAHLRPDLDVILADYALPQFNAMEALRLLQARDLDVPLLIVTGVLKGEEAVACLTQGADDYLLKDRLERLGPAVERALEAKILRDERRAARRDARISTRQWRATFDAISDPLFLLDAGGRILRCNQAAVDFIGQPHGEIIGQRCCELVHRASKPVEGCPSVRALETQERASLVWQKEDRWLEATVDPMLDEEGYLIGFVHLLEEITEQKQAEEAVRRRARELELFNRAGHAFNTSLDLDEVLGAVLEEVRRVLGVAGCSIWLRDSDTDALICRQASGPQGDTVRGWRLAAGEGIVGWVVSHGKSSIVADAQTDERHFEDVDEQTGLGLRSILTVPLRSERDTIGALQAVDETSGRFNAGDAALLKSLAASATLAIQKAQMYERAQHEIVERRRAEAALQEAEARYRTLFEETPIGLYRTTSDGEILEANSALATMLGYSDRESFLEANALDFYLDPEDRSRCLKVLDSRDTWESVEVRLRRQDSQIIWVQDTGRAIRDDDGRVRYYDGALRDITERREAQKALREERDLVAQLLETSPVCITRVNKEGEITFANPRAEEVLGLSRDEITERTYDDPEWYITDYDGGPLPEEKLPFRRVMETGGPVQNVRHAIEWPDGRRALLSINGAPLFDEQGELNGAVFAIEDVTERRRAQERISFQARLLDAAGEAVLATEPDGTLVYWNEAAEELYGWSEEEVLGRNVLDVTPALGSEERVTEIMERLKAGDSWSGEFSVQRRDGTVFHALVTNTPVRDEHGNLTAIIGVSRDITKLREIQEELERRAGNQWAINEFAIDLASAESVSDLYILIADRLKAITGALAVSVSIYNDDERTLVVKRVAADGGVISRINDMLDREIVGFRTPVGEDTYARMATEIVGTASDLSEVTFGKIPKPLAGAAQRMFGIDRFIGLALTDREDVMGTAVIAFKAGNHSPPEDILQTFARVAAASLRQKQAEEALRASEARFRATFEDAGIGMALVDEQGSVIASNPILQEMLGYSGEVLHGMGFTDFTHPEDRNKDRRQFEALMDGERDAYQMEKRYRRKDGRLIWGRLTASLVRDAAGEPAFAIGMVEDITEQRRIEETLRESERRFRQTFEHAASGMAIIDPDGFFLQVNQRFCDMLGYSCEELVGRGFQEVTHPQDREAALRVFRAQLAGKRDHEQFEKRFIRRDGRAVWTLMSTAMLHDSKGNPLYQISQIQDISKRHEAEKALEQRLAELALLNQIGNQITRPLGLEAVLESAVEIVQRSFGYHHVAILTMNEHGGKLEEKVVLGRFADVVPEGFQMDLDDGLIGWVARHGETVVVNDVEGDPRYINYYPDQILTRSELSVPIRTGGDVVGVLDVQSEKLGAFGEDDVMVMETVADQIAVALENARLYTAERDARRQLRDLASYLQNIREEERTRIAREIHDEFGQMMTALKMDLFWLTKRLPHEETELLRKADAMSDTIDETLENVRRISSELRPGILDDLGLAAAIEWQAETFSERSGIVCELHLDEEGDHLGRQPTTALFRILQEALTNVARHADASRVRVDLTVGPTGVTLTVEDDGRGITQSELADGESLGLMGMRERAHTLGGRVTFEEGPGNGTIVVAQIPRHGQEARPFTSVG